MSRDQEASQEYEKLFAQFSNKIEHIIKRIIIGLITLLVIIQVLLHIPGLALYYPLYSTWKEFLFSPLYDLKLGVMKSERFCISVGCVV